jgi:Spx/MgsR family transcriptional regulator
MIRVYGLKNCDTCRKARAWLDGEGGRHEFVDLRADGVGEDRIGAWTRALGWEKVLNRRSTTWRSLGEADKAGLDEQRAIALMAAHPALIKRPVFELGEDCFVGFGEAERRRLADAVRR